MIVVIAADKAEYYAFIRALKLEERKYPFIDHQRQLLSVERNTEFVVLREHPICSYLRMCAVERGLVEITVPEFLQRYNFKRL